MDLGLDGKVVFVTGGSGGIGRAIVKAFAAEGAKVAVYALAPVDHGDAHARYAGDVRDPAALDAAVDAARERFGRVDVCVACAGIWPAEPLPLHEQPEERVRDVIDVNLLGTLWTARAFLRALARTGPHPDGRGASMVMIGSTAGRFGEAGHAEVRGQQGRPLRAAPLPQERDRRDRPARPREPRRPRLDDHPDDGRDARPRGRPRGDADHAAGAARDARGHRARRALFFASPTLARHVTGETLTVAGGMEGRVLRYASADDPAERREITRVERTSRRAGRPRRPGPRGARRGSRTSPRACRGPRRWRAGRPSSSIASRSGAGPSRA